MKNLFYVTPLFVIGYICLINLLVFSLLEWNKDDSTVSFRDLDLDEKLGLTAEEKKNIKTDLPAR
jgi:hypothetical protein